ncbi:hypothetical protein Pla52nx_004695 [Stieleria varia]|uniref:hypothetical protein n=2 Tax=Stieleria varia TaxID=2528005 RepID=UPI00313B0F30
MRYNPMVASERYSAATEDDRTMRWTEATHRADENGNHNGVARSTPPLFGNVLDRTTNEPPLVDLDSRCGTNRCRCACREHLAPIA